jgi:nucleoside-diphosphate-sugar epimerase
LARALIVGCGCRGRALGARLAREGWAVRGTTRVRDNFERIEASGIEPAEADPERPGTLLDLLVDVTAILWLLGCAAGGPESLAAIHGPRLERLLEKLVDTPVRGFVYEAAGSVRHEDLERGAAIVSAAAERWRIPVQVVATDPDDFEAWREAMLDATRRLVSKSRNCGGFAA